MRKAALLALFALLPLSAKAADTPTESVIVDGGTVTGMWQITMSNQVQKDGFFGALKWGPKHEGFCRIGGQSDGLTMNCLSGPRNVTVTVDGDHIHFAQGVMLAHLVLDGRLQSPTHFEGHQEVKLALLDFPDSDPSSGTKLKISADAPDAGGKSALLRTVLTDGLDPVPHDDDAIRKGLPASGQIPRLGAVQIIAYLGQQTWIGLPGKDQVDYFSIYAVEFDSGERICGLHQRPDGVLDAFLCV